MSETGQHKQRDEGEALRPCPFCANTNLTVARLGYERKQFVVVTCSECGAIGPRANATDPQGHAEFLWNQRFGVGKEH